MSNFFDKNIIVEYDAETEIINITAKEQLFINTVEELDYLHNHVLDFIKNNVGDKKVYIMLDLDKYVISPSLGEIVAERSRIYYEKIIYPDGITSYGRTISRITIKKSVKEILEQQDRIYATKEESLAYLNEQRKLNNVTTED